MRTTLALLVWSLILAAPAFAQESIEQDVRPLILTSVDSDAHPDVSVVVTAPADLVGLDLDEGSVRLFEDSGERDVVVTKLPNDELEVLLLLDTSGSMADAWDAATAAALGFVDQMPNTTRIGVMGFGTEPLVASEFTTDAESLTTAVDSLRPRGETALYDAIAVALQQFTPGDNVRRNLVLLSDGGDTVSVTNLIDAIASLQNSEIGFYAIELESFENDSAVLEGLAAAGGGVVVPAVDGDALAQIYGRIASELVNQYEVAFVSEGFGDTRLQIVMEAGSIAAVADSIVQFPTVGPAPPTEPRNEPTAATPPAALRVIEIPPLRDGTLVTISWIQSDMALRLGLAAAFAALAVALAFLLYPRPRAIKMSAPPGTRPVNARPRTTTVLGEVAAQFSVLAERFLGRRGRSKSLERTLERAGIMLRPGEFIVFVGSLTLAAFAIGVTIRGPLVGLAASALTVLGAMLYVQRRQRQRVAAFADQLEETLQLMAGTLRAGYGLLQAVDTVAQEAPSPTGEEFRRLVAEVRLGRDLDEALEALSERVGNDDFVWVVGAIQIQREVGGDLAEVLDTVAQTIRDRNQIKRHVRALSADGRLSAAILIPLPFVVGAIIFAIVPDYINELFVTTPGRVMIGLGLVLMAIGSRWMARVVRVEF